LYRKVVRIHIKKLFRFSNINKRLLMFENTMEELASFLESEESLLTLNQLDFFNIEGSSYFERYKEYLEI